MIVERSWRLRYTQYARDFACCLPNILSMSMVDAEEARLLTRLQQNPNDINALVDLGMMAARQGKLEAALLATKRAASLAPHDLHVLRSLGHVYHDRAEWRAAQECYERVLECAPGDATAHEGACYAATRLGDLKLAQHHRDLAFRGRALTVAPYTGSRSNKPLTVLLCVSALGGNMDTRVYLPSDSYAVTKLVVEYADEVKKISECDLIFNAIGDADRCATALETLTTILATSRRPILNHPRHVLVTSRLTNSRRFANVENVLTPKIKALTRGELLSSEGRKLLTGAGLDFPLIVRAEGFHTGEYCERFESYSDIAATISTWPVENMLVCECIDVRGADGFNRKYRVMTVGGELYPLHMAASRHWKVHYMSSDMAENAALREEEAAFLHDPQRAIGTKAMLALQHIIQALKLEYAGIDFGVDAAGKVVFFEANATMIVPKAPADIRWDYKRHIPEHIHAAVARLLEGGFPS
jgi:tetratricopeptide (TPR) repeat protein